MIESRKPFQQDYGFFSGQRNVDVFWHQRLPLVRTFRGQTLILRPDRAGDQEDDFAAVGGTGLFLFNLEYRFPLFGAVGGMVFYDAGNVWADWRDMDPAGLKGGAGLGVRYLSPIGPLRLDIGWKLDREPGEQDFAVSVSFGNPF